MDGQPSAQGLRELAYELVRKIEYQLGDLGDLRDGDDKRIADTVAECEQLLSEIKVYLQPDS